MEEINRDDKNHIVEDMQMLAEVTNGSDMLDSF